MWSQEQKRVFAKRCITEHFDDRSLTYLTGPMREAIVEAFCFGIVRGQDATSVKVEAMDDLLIGVREAILDRKGPNFFNP